MFFAFVYIVYRIFVVSCYVFIIFLIASKTFVKLVCIRLMIISTVSDFDVHVSTGTIRCIIHDLWWTIGIYKCIMPHIILTYKSSVFQSVVHISSIIEATVVICDIRVSKPRRLIINYLRHRIYLTV